MINLYKKTFYFVNLFNHVFFSLVRFKFKANLIPTQVVLFQQFSNTKENG